MLLWLSVLIIILCVLGLKLYVELTKGKVTSNACMVGKTILITGGNSGLGYETAIALASRGTRIIIADCNDSTESRTRIIQQTSNPNVVMKKFDLSSLDSVRRLAKEINKEEERLDVLINNAGVGYIAGMTDDGLAAHMQVNNFGAFLLTHLLIDLLKKSSPSRIIFVSSYLAFANTFTIGKLNQVIHKQVSYNNTKFCNIVISNMFAKKLQGTGVTCNAVHPGLVSTPIYRSAISSSFLDNLYFVIKLFGKTACEGAQCQIQCALSQELSNVSGQFFSDCKTMFQPFRARNPVLGQKVWEQCEQLVKLKPEDKLSSLN